MTSRQRTRLTAIACLSVGLVCAALPDASWAADANPGAVNSERIAALVRQLGADEFSARESATEELTKIGLPAFKALEDAAQSPDREVRYRAVRILGIIRELDLQRRLEAFLQGKGDDNEYALPAWGRFKKQYGDQASARALFVEMQRADAEILALLDRDPKLAGELFAARTAQLQQAIAMQPQGSNTFGQIMTLLFVAAEPDADVAVQHLSSVFNFCHQPMMLEALRETSKGGIPRKVLGGLIERSENWSAYQAMMLANQHGMKEGLTPALKILKNDGNRVPHMAQYALLTLAKLGDKSHLPIVENLFEDKSVLSKMQENNKIVHEVQVRDAALAAAVYLSKQDVKKFFPEAAKTTITDPQQLFFNARVIGFSSEEARDAAFKKWAEVSKGKDPAGAESTEAEKAPAEPKPDGEPTKADS